MMKWENMFIDISQIDSIYHNFFTNYIWFETRWELYLWAKG